MASNSETGHAKNVANFQTLINSVTGIGPGYQPSKNALKLTALNPQLVACQAANAAVISPLIAYNTAASVRKALFDPLNKLTTRLLAIFKGTDALPQQKSYAKTIADKIRGTKNKPPAVPGEDSHSTSQRSFVMRTENFATFIGMLDAEPTYTPAETELQITTLQALLADMNTENNDTDLAYQALRTVRSTRNTALYADGTGLLDTAMAVKEYVKGAFGTSSLHYKAIKGLKFIPIGEDPNG